ncbi:hypothetical protein BGY98DRAFT_936471 [Russula aff. rugulosa BPL654]|nr:hypothetical protein BGY98DRAFT_936471 [Russula aff. rugulosa BPL654]
MQTPDFWPLPKISLNGGRIMLSSILHLPESPSTFSHVRHLQSLTADDRRASLGAKRFKELQLMKFAWHGQITDIASSNSHQIEVVDLNEYRAMLEHDVREYEFEKGENEFVIDD